MADIKIDDHGLSARLAATSAGMRRELVKAMSEATAHVNKTVSDYTQTTPPRRPNQTYTRTFRLKRSWSVREVSATRGVAASRGVRYAPYVMDAERQVGIHRDRWWTTKSVSKDEAARVRAIIYKGINKALSKI